MPIVDILQTVYSLANVVYAQVQQVKANQEQCKRLAERIQIVIEAIKKLDAQKSDVYQSGLTALKNCLENCSKVIKKFADDTWYKQILNAGTAKEQFVDLNQQLERAIAQLNLGLNVQQIMNQQHDKQDQAKDYAHICSQQAVIIKLIEGNSQKLNKINLNQEEEQLILRQQFASVKRRIKELDVSGSTEKELIDSSLLIRYFDLSFVEKMMKQSHDTYRGQWQNDSVVIKSFNLREKEKKSFLQAVKTYASLNHKNIVRLYGVCTELEQPYLVMEYLENDSLHCFLEKNSLSATQQKQFMLESAKGLSFLHKKMIKHGCLNSHHVMLDGDKHIKLIGFKALKRSSDIAVEWQAPECLKNAEDTFASDVYSLGMLFWEIVTGKKIFSEYQGSDRQQKIKTAVLAGQRPQIPAHVPEIYRDIITKCWQSDPNKRPFAQDIAATLENTQLQDNAIPQKDLAESKEDSAVLATQQPLVDGEAYFQQGMQHEKTKEYAKAYACYEQARQKNHVKAYTNVAFFLLKGQGGVKLDKAKARDYFEVAAKKDHVRAMVCLALMLEHGDGIPKDLHTALHWHQQAAAGGHSASKTAAEKLEKMLGVVVYPSTTASLRC
jgi:hypothetical protein